jgi:hypothetical protein
MNRNESHGSHESHGSKRVPKSNIATLKTSFRKFRLSDNNFYDYHSINTQTLYDFNEMNSSRIAV